MTDHGLLSHLKSCERLLAEILTLLEEMKQTLIARGEFDSTGVASKLELCADQASALAQQGERVMGLWADKLGIDGSQVNGSQVTLPTILPHCAPELRRQLSRQREILLKYVTQLKRLGRDNLVLAEFGFRYVQKLFEALTGGNSKSAVYNAAGQLQTPTSKSLIRARC